MKTKICTAVVALPAALPMGFIATASAAGAQPPGQCKQVNGNCNGKSEESTAQVRGVPGRLAEEARLLRTSA